MEFNPSPEAHGSLIYLSTVWTGSSWQDGSHQSRPLCWVLSLTPSTEYPSAFGAILHSDGVLALHGTWTPHTRSLKLISVDVDRPERVCTYEAVLRSEDNGAYCLFGSSREGNELCRFALTPEDDDPSVQISGVWLGQAVPDASLEAFAIPTNPIKWSLAVLGSGQVFGAGYFDDSGDVPGRPLLFYVLRGAREGNQLRVVKQYERAAGVGVVQYGGQLQQDGSMNGEWRNEEAGSFGAFRCRRESVSAYAAHSTCCSVCQAVLRAAELAYEDMMSESPWRCCALCYGKGAAGGRRVVGEPVLVAVAAKGSSCAEIVGCSFELFADRPLVGRRSGSGGKFEWYTYGQVQPVAQAIAASMAGRAGERVALIGALSPSYVAVMSGIVLSGAVVVPLDIGLDATTMGRCLQTANVTVLFVTSDLLATLTEAVRGMTIQQLVVIDDAAEQMLSNAHVQNTSANGSNSTNTLSSLISRGLSLASPKLPSRQSSDLVALLFTSGSTGQPKAAAYTERLALPSGGVSNVLPLVKLDLQRFHPSFLISLLAVMQVGGRRAIVDDLGRVLDVTTAVRPTHISAPPAFWLYLQREYAARVAQLPPNRLASDAARAVRLALGNRLVLCASGGALLGAATLEFARATLQLPLEDLYGSRETGGIARNGVIYPGVDVRFLPLSGDDETSGAATSALAGEAPLTRGEVVVHSTRLIEGYFSDGGATSAAFVDLDGKRFYRTGDVGELRNGRLVLLDRCGAMYKLSQSEWLAPAKIEALLEGFSWIAQALIVVPSPRVSAVAVVVLSPLGEQQLASVEGEEERASGVLTQVQLWCAHHRLRAHEMPKFVLVETGGGWTVENGMLTPTFKKRRAKLLQKYAQRCEKIVADASLSTTPSRSPMTSSLPVAMIDLLSRCGVSLVTTRADAALSELGVDSLATAQLAALLYDEGVRAANAHSIHLYPLAHWGALLAAARSGNHSVLPDRVSADNDAIDWQQECRLPRDITQLHRVAERPPGGDVLLTGGTGFLGPHLLSAILAATAPQTKIYVIVRAATQPQAAQRLKEAMQSADLFDEKIWARIVPLAGDLSARQRFGLDERFYTEELVARVSDVFHSGARVDVTQPYSALKASNVGGTLTAIDLALRSGARLHYVSSASALPARSPAEAALVRDSIDFGAKSGYGASKAVAELLLQEAAEKLALPLRVFRYSAISGDERSHHWNRHDFSFLLFSAVAAVHKMPQPARSHLHWVPVAWAARSTVALSLAPNTRGQCFHLVGDGPTAEQGREAMRAVGLVAEPCTPAQWIEAIGALPRQHTAFPLVSELRALDFAAPATHDIPTSNTRAALAALGVPWFKITDEMLRSCMKVVKDDLEGK